MAFMADYDGRCVETGVKFGKGRLIEKVEGGYRIYDPPDAKPFWFATKVCWICWNEVTLDKVQLSGGNWNDATAGYRSCHCGC